MEILRVILIEKLFVEIIRKSIKIAHVREFDNGKLWWDSMWFIHKQEK
jgi:hypothetical protein